LHSQLPVLAASLALATGALAESRSELGKIGYQSTCADCHGQVGKGDGPYNEFLRPKVPDLTNVAQRNGGVFPVDRLYEIIDGRATVKGHGSKQMPLWGNVYNEKPAQDYKGFAHNLEQFARVRILTLFDYLYSLQTRR
jgi:hypothetical protein